MGKKSILYIITKSVWGGAAKYVYDLANNLPNDRFDIQIAAGGKNKFAREIIKRKIAYYNIHNFQRTINPFRDVFAFFEILELLFRLKPDIIHVNSSKAGGITGLAAQIYEFFSHKKICSVFTVHGWAFTEDRPRWQIFLIKLSSKITALLYQKIICVSEFDRQIAIKNRIAPSDKLFTIHNGIDLQSIAFLPKEEAQKKLLKRTSPFVIGTVAEWTKNKGLIYLLKAISALKQKNCKFDVILIGSGENPDKDKMHSFIKKHQLKNVYLHEWVDNAASYLKAFDVFVLPSLKEGLPYTILEAMAAQLPVITTTVGGIPEIVDNNINGFLIKPKNSQLLAERIFYSMENPQETKKMAQEAHLKIIKKFSLEKMIQRTIKAYDTN